MDKINQTKTIWHGKDSIEAIPEILDEAGKAEIILPDNYNHTLFRKFHPDAPSDALEDIDIKGDINLLTEIADIRGLEEFSLLSTLLRNRDISLNLVSPPRVTIIDNGYEF